MQLVLELRTDSCPIAATHRCPPPRMRNAGEVCLWHFVLHGVNHSGEAEDAHGDEEEEAAHLLVALAQCKAKRTQASGVSGQFQDAKDPHKPHDPEHLAEFPHLSDGLHVCLVLYIVFIAVKKLQDGLQVLWQDGNQIHGVEHAPAKCFKVRSGNQAEKVLHGEKGDAHGLHILPVGLTTELACVSPILHLLHCVECHGHQRN